MAIAESIIEALGMHIDDTFTTIHNYIDTEAMILRKGSVSAAEGEVFLIPINRETAALFAAAKAMPIGIIQLRTEQGVFIAAYRQNILLM